MGKNNKKKKGNTKNGVIGIVIIIAFIILFNGMGADKKESSTQTKEESDSYTIKFGELLNQTISNLDVGKVLVIKAKIKGSYSNNATINQNYYNVEDLIVNQGCSEFDQIQYWAVADMSSGSESKVISFTLNSDLIQAIADENIVGIQFGDYVEDLYIHPSLQQ